jgi:hypothetical protein
MQADTIQINFNSFLNQNRQFSICLTGILMVLNIYIHIKQNYFPTLTAFIPAYYKSLIEKQDEIKHHHSKWVNASCLQFLNNREKTIVETLIQTDSIIEEQKILLTTENLLYNAIN